jgi:hypothetical protein
MKFKSILLLIIMFFLFPSNSYCLPQSFSWASGTHYQSIVGNFNDDGHTDIGIRDSSNGRWHFAFFNGADTYHNTRNFDWAPGAHYQPLAADFNGDGRTDIGLRDSSNGRWHFAFFNGSDSYHNARNFDWAPGAHYQPLVGDFNGDGRTDIGLRDTSNGRWHFAFFNGLNWYHNERNYNWTPGVNYQSHVADLNYDGVLDAIIRDSNSGIWHFKTQLLPKTSIGIFYYLWHCPHRYPVLDISKAKLGAQNWGGIDAFHWRDEPALGYYCLSEDDSVLKKHAEMLRDAGIDFVFLDATNHGSISKNDRTDAMILKPLENLLKVWASIPGAPKVVPWAPLPKLTPNDQTLRVMTDAIDRAKLGFNYLGKPLILVGKPSKEDELDQDALNQLSINHTVRFMGGLLPSSDQSSWSFLQPCKQGFRISPWTSSNRNGVTCEQRSSMFDGKIEQVSITAAYQETYISDTTTATPKNYGNTLRAQFQTLFENPQAPIATITSWNEWIAQRQMICLERKPEGKPREEDNECIKWLEQHPNGNKIFVDVYDEEYSRDVEPSLGGRGAYYYDVMRSCIKLFRSGGFCGSHNTNELCCRDQ